jgi:hypothetical protein
MVGDQEATFVGAEDWVAGFGGKVGRAAGCTELGALLLDEFSVYWGDSRVIGVRRIIGALSQSRPRTAGREGVGVSREGGEEGIGREGGRGAGCSAGAIGSGAG